MTIARRNPFDLDFDRARPKPTFNPSTTPTSTRTIGMCPAGVGGTSPVATVPCVGATAHAREVRMTTPSGSACPPTRIALTDLLSAKRELAAVVYRFGTPLQREQQVLGGSAQPKAPTSRKVHIECIS